MYFENEIIFAILYFLTLLTFLILLKIKSTKQYLVEERVNLVSNIFQIHAGEKIVAFDRMVLK